MVGNELQQTHSRARDINHGGREARMNDKDSLKCPICNHESLAFLKYPDSQRECYNATCQAYYRRQKGWRIRLVKVQE